MQKYAFVTGGSGGIGQAICKTLAKNQYIVLIHYYSNEEKAKELRKEIKLRGGKSYLIKGNLNKESGIKNIFKKINLITNKLDLLVNNAGIYSPYLIEDYPFDRLREIVNVNFLAAFLITQLSVPLLRKSDNPQIINIASRLGKEKVVDKSSGYSASKAALIQFTKSCALELRRYKIRANAVCPGFTRTDMNKSTLMRAKELKHIEASIPLGRIGEPQDIANLVNFLASNESVYINGESIGVNGGSILV